MKNINDNIYGRLNYENLKQQLLLDGFFVIKNVLPKPFIDSLNSDIKYLYEKNVENCGKLGDLIDFSYQTENFCKLLCWEKTWKIIRNIGFPNAKFWSGYVVCKKGNSDKSYWHQDWTYWSNPVSALSEPIQLFIMYYTTNTNVNNGCLRVLKESHRKRVFVHNLIRKGHDCLIDSTQELNYYEDIDEQLPLEVNAGDLIIGDARILHATYANNTENLRPLIVFDIFPNFSALPESIQSSAMKHKFIPLPTNMDYAIREKVEKLIINYIGNALPEKWNRIIGEYFPNF